METCEEGDDATDCVDRVDKDKRATGVFQQEVVEEEILLLVTSEI